MVTIAPKEKGWSDVGEAFGSGFVSSYQNRSDELALQNAISNLPPNASPQDIIKAVTGTRTHNPDSKKNMLTNYFKANEMEETARHNKASEGAAYAKANKVKEPAISEKPMDAEQVQNIEKVMSNPDYDSWDIAKKQLEFNKGMVSGVNSKRILEAEEMEYNKSFKLHEQTEKYNEKIDNDATAARKQIQYIKKTKEAVSKTSPWSAVSVLKNFGPLGKALSDALLSKDDAAINAAVPVFLEGNKEIFGVRLSDADLAVLLDKLPSIGKSQEANDEILDIMDKYANQSILKGKIADEIKSKSKNKLRPVDFKEEVNKRFDKAIEPVKLRDPDTGVEFEAERYRVEDWIRAGAELVHE